MGNEYVDFCGKKLLSTVNEMILKNSHYGREGVMWALTLFVLGDFLLTLYWGAFFRPSLFLWNYKEILQ